MLRWRQLAKVVLSVWPLPISIVHTLLALQEIELLLTNDNATFTAVNARYPMPQASRL